jgi:Sec-independent protein translocase protein TatA
MDSFFGIGLPELILILLFAGLVMGPHRIREIARMLGRITAQLQRISREFTRQLNAELDAVDSGEMKGALKDVRSLQDEVEALRRELAQVPRTLREQGKSVITEGKEIVAEGEAALSGTSSKKTTEAIPPEPADAQSEQDAPVEIERKPALPKAIEIPEDPES